MKILRQIAARLFGLRGNSRFEVEGRANDPKEAQVSKAVEIPYSVFAAMEHDLEAGPIGDGRDDQGRAFWIRRYTSRTTGKRYDCVCVSGLDKTPRCLEWPSLEAVSGGSASNP